jgi:peptide-methionine (S)-S-oxide reductase
LYARHGRSYCYNQEEVEIVNKVKGDLQALLNAKLLKGAYSSVRVTTDVRKASDCSPFFAAHAEHQDYLTANPSGYCNHGFKFKEWPALPSENEKDSPSSAP